MQQQYMVIDDKLIPEDIAPLVLSEKLRGIIDPPVTVLVHFMNDPEWKVPYEITDAEKKTDMTAKHSTRIMIEKMAAGNNLKKSVLQVRIYPGSPAVRVIDFVKKDPLYPS